MLYSSTGPALYKCFLEDTVLLKSYVWLDKYSCIKRCVHRVLKTTKMPQQLGLTTQNY